MQVNVRESAPVELDRRPCRILSTGVPSAEPNV